MRTVVDKNGYHLIMKDKPVNEVLTNPEDQVQRRVDSWNCSVQVGAEVAYLKSELEGKVILKTVGQAYIFGGEPAVDLEHIGLALLSKVETFSG